MTASLPVACFLKELLKAKNHHCAGSSSSLVGILIVDDNAQLTPENRIKNAMSFATNEEECHQNSRWCSQPCLMTSILNHQRSHSRSSRRRSYSGTCTEDSMTSQQQQNQSWKVLPLTKDDHHASSSSNVHGMPLGNCSPCNPPISRNGPMHKLFGSSQSFLDAPARLPQRPSSPGSLQSRVLEKTKLLDQCARKSLNSVLGDMAPRSPLIEERRRRRRSRRTTGILRQPGGCCKQQ